MSRGSDRGRRPQLHRDNQQWVYDWAVKETGRASHFQGEGRGDLPASVKTQAMISKHLGLAGRRLERLAEAEAAASHDETAVDLYFQAALAFMRAQHNIFENNAEKLHLHQSLLRCYDALRSMAGYRIERVEVPWEETIIAGYLHLAPSAAPAPCVLHITGCDITKESWPNPSFNQAARRGLHVFAMDGPGQGESNVRGVRLEADNYERAASAVIDRLSERPEIDPNRIGVYGLSFGSRWALRVAAHDHRVAAVAAPWATYGDLRYLMDADAPRFKQLFMYLTQSETEQQLDEFAAAMTLEETLERIAAPVLLVTGEFDQRTPLDETYRLFDQLKSPSELWVFADQHHITNLAGGKHGQSDFDIHSLACDWIRDRLAGKSQLHAGQVVYVEPGGAGPNALTASTRRHWYELAR